MAQSGQQLKSTKLKKFSHFICNSALMIIGQNNKKLESILEIIIGKCFQSYPYKIRLSCHSNHYFLSGIFRHLNFGYFCVFCREMKDFAFFCTPSCPVLSYLYLKLWVFVKDRAIPDISIRY